MTETFSEEQRHYKDTYLETCEVFDEILEVSLFSSIIDSYEIYFSYGGFYGIIYVDKEDAVEKYETVKHELELEYRKHGYFGCTPGSTDVVPLVTVPFFNHNLLIITFIAECIQDEQWVKKL